MYTCGWFMLMYGRNQHNIVKQLSTNKKVITHVKIINKAIYFVRKYILIQIYMYLNTCI